MCANRFATLSSNPLACLQVNFHTLGNKKQVFKQVLKHKKKNRLFLNNEPIGLFGIIETFQDPWPADEFSNGDKDYSSGYLYQGHIMAAENPPMQHLSDLSYYENLTDYSLGEYSIKAGPNRTKVEGYSALQNFTKFVHEVSNTTSESDWEEYLDNESFLRA